MENTNTKSEAALREEKILEFWKENKIFQQTLNKKSSKGEFIFYDGPVTANAKPVLHTMVPFTFKDIIPRYKTMRGYHVPRRGGWDTHGLPVELQIEKKLGFKSKAEIENYGIADFNKLCKESVWEFTELWKSFTKRMGYWADQDNAFVTYHNTFIESVWNIVKEVNEQNLLYKDYKVVPWCPRCGTALSSHELAQGYEDVKDLSLYVKFKIVGFDKAYFVAWTTTPWTLPGNVGLAVGPDVVYVEAKMGDEILVVAKERLSVIEGPYEIVAEHTGKEMVGMQYEPLFPYLKDQVEAKGESTEKAFKVYAADFVTTTDGTGIVHTAVMYGQDDFVLGTQVGLPKHHLVNLEGKFVSGTDFLEGRFVKEKDENGKPTLDVDIINYLTAKNLFFKKENYQHSYPHCWRCKTALIYYARDSWYIRMSDPKVKEQLISENKKINWEPSHIRDGRFGEWLREIKDWAISRERYWGTPLPVWQCDICQKVEVIGGVEALKAKTKKSGNKYFVMRHGQAQNNIGEIFTLHGHQNAPLTQKGKEEVEESFSKFNEKIDVIISSPYTRAKETAEIICKQIKFPFEKVILDSRIREWEVSSEFEDLNRNLMENYYQHEYTKSPFKNFKDGESFVDVVKRVGEVIYSLEKEHKNQNILIVAHDGVGRALQFVAQGLNFEELKQKNPLKILYNAEILGIGFVTLPHNENYELDLHKPYIDEVKLGCAHSTSSGQACGGELVRTKEVMDVWFDSGAMPFAQDHYPFENKKFVDGPGFPADYISEAIDQTRGWFYTLHAIGVLMGRGLAYKNVICLGHLLDANGKKMSKSLGNVVDPWSMMDKYGVDTLRMWMYSVNQPGESKNFDEKTVTLLQQQVFTLLYNVLAFYELYRDKEIENNDRPNSKNILDKWILIRLDELNNLATDNLDNYKLLEPVRAVRDFIGDLSTWYLRRSRERIKDGDKDAKQTLYFVLKTLVKIMAPFAPFTAEDVWLKLKGVDDDQSVHLTEWPKQKFKLFDFGGGKILENMDTVRKIVSLGLEARQKAKLPVKQALSSLKYKVESGELEKEYLELIKDELNVKEVIFDANLSTEVELDTTITPALKAEGEYREFMRDIQDRRKQMGLNPGDKMPMTISDLYKKYKIQPSLQLHMLRVAAVASLICDNMTVPVSKEEVVTSALIHDIGSIVKFDLNLFPEFFEPEGVPYWKEVKDEFTAKYGSNDHVAIGKIAREIGVSERIQEIVDSVDFVQYDLVRDSEDMVKKIVVYSDNRVSPKGILSYQARMEESKVRYARDNKGSEEERVRLVACGADTEKQIFAKCKIKPEDITDESIAHIIEELRGFVVK